MLRAILNKSWKQYPLKQQLYGHQPPISKTIQIRLTRLAWHYWRSKNALKSDVLQWSPSHGRTSVGQPTRTYIQQLCTDTGCSLEDLPEGMMIGTNSEWERERERVREICASSVIWWWRFIALYLGHTPRHRIKHGILPLKLIQVSLFFFKYYKNICLQT